MSEGGIANDPADALAERFAQLRAALLAWFCRRMPDKTEAEDLVQESFLRVAQRGDLSSVEFLDGYIYRTAASVLTDRQRRLRQTGVHGQLDAERLPANDVDPFRDLAGRQELRQVSAALMTLPERTRTIFVLRRIENMRHKEIAIRLGISVSAVEKHMVRALERLALEMAAWQ